MSNGPPHNFVAYHKNHYSFVCNSATWLQLKQLIHVPHGMYLLGPWYNGRSKMASLTQLSDGAHCCLRIWLGLSIREPQLSFVWLEVFIAWKLDSERKYPKAVKVVAKNFFRLDTGRYAFYICLNLSVQTKRFNRKLGTDSTFQQTKWQRNCRNLNPHSNYDQG